MYFSVSLETLRGEGYAKLLEVFTSFLVSLETLRGGCLSYLVEVFTYS